MEILLYNKIDTKETIINISNIKNEITSLFVSMENEKATLVQEAEKRSKENKDFLARIRSYNKELMEYVINM